MGSPKPLLPIGDTTFLERVVGQFLASQARPVVVVLGHEAERIRDRVQLDDARVVVNPDFRQGMLSSIRAGLRALEMESVSGALVCPVDHPEVGAPLIDLLITRFEETQSSIVVPTHEGKRGHPVLFAAPLFEELLKAPDSVGARKVVWDHADDVLEVPTGDRGILMDIDTPEQYKEVNREGRERRTRGTNSG